MSRLGWTTSIAPADANERLYNPSLIRKEEEEDDPIQKLSCAKKKSPALPNSYCVLGANKTRETATGASHGRRGAAPPSPSLETVANGN